MSNIKIEMTKEEAQAAINLMDAAVRAQGINAAGAALHIATIVQKALDAENINENAGGTVGKASPPPRDRKTNKS